MKYDEISISECLDKVNKSLFLPDIQRPFVWEEKDIYLLFDSICRDYPINTVLFWFLKRETLQGNQWIKRLKFITEGFEKKYRKSMEHDNEIDTSAIQRDNYFLAIDGQQRLTSLYLSLIGNYKIKIKREWHYADLYYNFDSGIEEIDDGILYEFKFFPNNSGDVFIETIEDKKNKTAITKNWIRVKYIYGINERKNLLDSVKYRINELIKVDIDNTKNNAILDFWFKLKQDKLISYYNEQNQNYDKVLDIFVRTNSGGEKLTYSDLLFSFIKRHWGDARDKFSELLKQLNEGGRYDFDHDFILKAILFIHAKEQENLKYSTKNFTSDIIEDTKLNWGSKLSPAFKAMKVLITSRFQLTHYKLITSKNALIPLIYYIYKYDKKGTGEENNKLTTGIQLNMREWLLTCMLTGVFGGQSDGILIKAKKGLDESATNDYFPKEELYKKFNEAKPALVLKVTEDIISKATYNSIDSNLILSLLYKNTVDLAPISEENIPQQDHIFSKNEMKEAKLPKEKINSIYNIRWISASDNRDKSAESYEEWFKRLGSSVAKKHFIPEGNWSVSNFDQFLAARKKKFLEEILGQLNDTNGTSENTPNPVTTETSEEVVFSKSEKYWQSRLENPETARARWNRRITKLSEDPVINANEIKETEWKLAELARRESELGKVISDNVQDINSDISTKDFTLYSFNGQKFGKGRLVLAVIKDYVYKNPLITYNQLKSIFPDNLQGQETFTEENEAIDKKRKRNFINPDELINLADKKIAVSTEWHKDNIKTFIGRCKELNITVDNA